MALSLLVPGLLAYLHMPETTFVTSRGSLQATLDDAAPGSRIVLPAGTYRGPVTIDAPIHLQGEPGAKIVAPPAAEYAVAVTASGAAVSGIAVRGGDSGLLVRDADEVTIEDVSVIGSSVHGIEVVDASAHIEGARIERLLSALAQGIEIRNADGRPDSSVIGSRIEGGQEGIVAHVSEVRFIGNHVSNTTMRGIAVTEMSDGFVEGNYVVNGQGAGLYCGDMSRCQFDNNEIGPIRQGDGGRSTQGWGLVVTYHAVASSSGNRFEASAGETMTSLLGHITERSPLDPASVTTLIPGFAIALLAAGVLALGSYGLATAITPKITRRQAGFGIARATLVSAVVGVVLIQSFHMVEHFLQIYRIHVDLIPSRGGLAGPGVDTEWVHMGYNGIVLLLLVVAVSILHGRTTRIGANLTLAAVVLQGWHVIEHVAKVVQHVITGAKVNEGLLGRYFDLAWFHFTINLTVYGLSVGAAAICIWSLRNMRIAAPVVQRPARA